MLIFDIETTGLSPFRDVILEVGAILVGDTLEVIETYEAAISHHDSTLAPINPYTAKMHSDNGLWEAIRKRGIGLQEAEQALIRLCSKQPGSQVLAGNSIHFDRSFVKLHMRELDAKLHYRMVDATSLMILLGPAEVPANDTPHRALADCFDSLNRLRYYRACHKYAAAPWQFATFEDSART